jgi:hypothetical protein
VTLFEIVFQVVNVKDVDTTSNYSSKSIDMLNDDNDGKSISMTTMVRIEEEVMNPVTSRINQNVSSNITSIDISNRSSQAAIESD